MHRSNEPFFAQSKRRSKTAGPPESAPGGFLGPFVTRVGGWTRRIGMSLGRPIGFRTKKAGGGNSRRAGVLASPASALALCTLVSALAALAPARSASAAQITYTSVSGIWHDPLDN